MTYVSSKEVLNVRIDYPKKIAVTDNAVQFDVLVFFPYVIDAAIVEIVGLGEVFRDIVYYSDMATVIIDYVNPPSGVHEFRLRIYSRNRLVYEEFFNVEFVEDPLGITILQADNIKDTTYKVKCILEVLNPPVEVYIEASEYESTMRYEKVYEFEGKLKDRKIYELNLGLVDLNKASLEVNIISFKDGLEWRRTLILPELS